MNLKEAIKEVKATRSVPAARCIAGVCRFHFGMNYEETARYAEKMCGTDAGEWEDLMMEVDAMAD